MPTITLDPSSIEFAKGDTPTTVNATTVDISDGATLNWSSSDTNIATVTQAATTVTGNASVNTITGSNEGSATITVSFADGDGNTATVDLPVTVTAETAGEFIVTARTDASTWSTIWGASGISMPVFVAVTDQDFIPVTGPYTVTLTGTPAGSLEHINGPTPLNNNGVAECYALLTGTEGYQIVITATLSGEGVDQTGDPVIIEMVLSGSVPPNIPSMVDGVIDDTDVENGVYVNINLVSSGPGQTVVLMIGGAEERFTTTGSDNILPVLVNESYLTNGTSLVGYYQVDAVGNGTFSALTHIQVNRVNGGGGVNDLEPAIIPEAEATGYINKVIADSTPHAQVTPLTGAVAQSGQLRVSGYRTNGTLVYIKSVPLVINADGTIDLVELGANEFFYPIGEGNIRIAPSLLLEDGSYHTANETSYIVDVLPPGSR